MLRPNRDIQDNHQQRTCQLKYIFQLSDVTSWLWQHSLKLFKSRYHTTVRLNFFTSRVINEWDKLLQEVAEALSINAFKNRLDRHWKSIMTPRERISVLISISKGYCVHGCSWVGRWLQTCLHLAAVHSWSTTAWRRLCSQQVVTTHFRRPRNVVPDGPECRQQIDDGVPKNHGWGRQLMTELGRIRILVVHPTCTTLELKCASKLDKLWSVGHVALEPGKAMPVTPNSCNRMLWSTVSNADKMSSPTSTVHR